MCAVLKYKFDENWRRQEQNNEIVLKKKRVPLSPR